MIKKNEKFILEVEDVIANKRSYKPESSIYFLIKNEVVVYVGQSVSPYTRISVHEKDKDFDSYFIEPCEYENLNEAEAYYVLKFNPIYNGMIPQNDFYKSLQKLKIILGVTLPELKKRIRREGIEPLALDYYDLRDFI